MSLQSLPIAPYLPEIVTRLFSEGGTPLLVVTSPTGTGKSIGIPSYLGLIAAQTPENPPKTFISVPTVNAAITLSNYAKLLLGKRVSVGYAAEGEIHYDDQTIIVYATAGHIRRKLLSNYRNISTRGITFCTVLILDEFHTGAIDDTIIYSIWRYVGSAGLTSPRLIILSATINKSLFPEKFILEVARSQFPVDIKYLEKDLPYLNRRKLQDAIYGLLTSFSTPTTILVFLAGKADIMDLKTRLEKDRRSKFHVFVAYSNLPEGEIAEILKPTPGEFKIILSTNLFETAITISDVEIVIDSLQEKVAVTSASGGLRLSLTYVSKSSATQRLGRVGRTMPGVCYRLMSKPSFDKLPEFRENEIDRVPLYSHILEIYAAGIDPVGLIPAAKRERIDEARRLLEQLGMMESGRPTDRGRMATGLTLSVRNSSLLYSWLEQGLPTFPGIVSVCLIDSYGPESYYFFPSDLKTKGMSSEKKFYIDKYMQDFQGDSDMESALLMWNFLMKKMGTYPFPKDRLRKVSSDFSLNYRKIKELVKSVRDTTRRLPSLYPRLKGAISPSFFTVENVLLELKKLIPASYSGREFTRGDSGLYTNVTEVGNVFILDTKFGLNRYENPPKRLYALAITEIKTAERVLRILSFSIPTLIEEKEVVPVTPPVLQSGIGELTEDEKLRRAMELLEGLNFD